MTTPPTQSEKNAHPSSQGPGLAHAPTHHAPEHETTRRTLTWIARLASIGVIALLALFAFGEPGPWPTPSEWAMLAFFPIGIVVGLILAWWREVLGACVAMGSLLVFFVLLVKARGTLPPNPALFALFAAPAPIFLSAGLLRARHRGRA
jgi:hypothetical protein